MERIADAIEAVNQRIGRLVAWLVPLLIGIVLAVVVLRYAFGWGRVWLQESYVWLNGVIVMLAIAYTLAQDAHVRIDLFYSRMAGRGRALVDLLGSLLLLLPLATTVLVQSLPYVRQSWQRLEASREAAGLPGVFLLKTIIPIAAGLLALQAIALIIKSARRLRA